MLRRPNSPKRELETILRHFGQILLPSFTAMAGSENELLNHHLTTAVVIVQFRNAVDANTLGEDNSPETKNILTWF